jgi:hypothetical protein
MADKKALLLRISPELWESLNRWARDDLRSVNAQIEFILREAVRRRAGRHSDAPLAASAPQGAHEASS